MRIAILIPLLALNVHGFVSPSRSLMRGHVQPHASALEKKNVILAQSALRSVTTDDAEAQDEDEGFSYVQFAKDRPFTNNVAIASTKTACADLIAQVVIAQTPIAEIDWARAFLFFAFGAIYSGGFQYLYQVLVFKKLFDVDAFTSQSWAEKFKDVEGLKQLGLQTALDLTILALIYLPAFYIFKASLFSGSADPTVWTSVGLDNFMTNFHKDELDALRVWLPADLVCFSVALYLRLPVRHIVSFGWTAYLSFMHGGH